MEVETKEKYKKELNTNNEYNKSNNNPNELPIYKNNNYIKQYDDINNKNEDITKYDNSVNNQEMEYGDSSNENQNEMEMECSNSNNNSNDNNSHQYNNDFNYIQEVNNNIFDDDQNMNDGENENQKNIEYTYSNSKDNNNRSNLDIIEEEENLNNNGNNNFGNTDNISNIQNFNKFNSKNYQINNNDYYKFNKEETLQMQTKSNYEGELKQENLLLGFQSNINSYNQNDFDNKGRKTNKQIFYSNLILNKDIIEYGKQNNNRKYPTKNSNNFIIDNNNNTAENQFIKKNDKNSIYDYGLNYKFNNKKTDSDKDEKELEEKSCFYSQDDNNDINNINNINNSVNDKYEYNNEKVRNEIYAKFQNFVKQIEKDMSSKKDDKMKTYIYSQDDVLGKELENINNLDFLKDKNEYLKYILNDLMIIFCRSQFKNQNFKILFKQDDHISSDSKVFEDKFHTIECFNDYNTSKADGDDSNKERQGIQIVIETDKKNNDVKSIFFRIGVFVPEENNDKKKDINDNNNISNNVNSSKSEKFLLTKGSEFQMHVLSKQFVFKNGSFVQSKKEQNYNVQRTVLLNGGGIIVNKRCTKYNDKDINKKYEVKKSLKEIAGSTDEVVYNRLKVDVSSLADFKKDNYEKLDGEKLNFQFTYFDDNSKVEQPQKGTGSKGGCLSCLSQCCGGSNKGKEPNEANLYDDEQNKANKFNYNNISENEQLGQGQIVKSQMDKNSNNINSVNDANDAKYQDNIGNISNNIKEKELPHIDTQKDINIINNNNINNSVNKNNISINNLNNNYTQEDNYLNDKQNINDNTYNNNNKINNNNNNMKSIDNEENNKISRIENSYTQQNNLVNEENNNNNDDINLLYNYNNNNKNIVPDINNDEHPTKFNTYYNNSKNSKNHLSKLENSYTDLNTKNNKTKFDYINISNKTFVHNEDKPNFFKITEEKTIIENTKIKELLLKYGKNYPNNNSIASDTNLNKIEEVEENKNLIK